MKNFQWLLTLFTLIAFTQCCPDKTAHDKIPEERSSYITEEYFKGEITSIATILKNAVNPGDKIVYGQGMILLDFGDDDLRYVIFKERSEDKNTEVFFRVKIENDIATAYDIKKKLSSGEKEVSKNTDYLDYFKLDYHGQFDHNNGETDSHKRLHRVIRGTVDYIDSYDITEFTGRVSSPNSTTVVFENFIISGVLDTLNLYPVEEELTHAFYEVLGGGPQPTPLFVELSPEHFH